MSDLSTELSVTAVLGADGNMGEQITDFRPRAGQLEMAGLIHQSIQHGDSQIIEAATGIGKSLAYLVPVFLSDKKVVISTGTKNLQDQLFNKDIPLVRRAIVSSKKTALLKGRSNYCCLHRVEKYRQQGQFQSHEMSSLFAALGDWAAHSDTGDISEFAAIPENDRLWFYATSNADNCLGNECPEFDHCFVVKARKKALGADLVVINHHLYFSDLALKEEGFGELLPQADVLIFDEAHQLPEIASHFYGNQITMRQIEMLCKDIVEAEVAEAPESKVLRPPSEKLKKSVADFRITLGQFPQKSDWRSIQFAPAIRQAIESIQDSCANFSEELEPLVSRGKELASGFRRLNTFIENLEQFLNPDDNQVNWYECNDRSFRLMLSPLEVADSFRQQLECSGFKSVFFTSATLSSQQSFDYYTRRLGLGDISTSRFDSPFDFKKQALLYIPDHLPDPSDQQYAAAFGALCRELIEATEGYCFILFTSYRMLSWTADYLRSKISYPLFVQGDYQRSELLSQYLQAKNPVLLGTSSFWEGVDVKGDQLRIVIIDKLPFKSPGDPVYKKRLQLVAQQGGNAFVDVQIPEATISLRQGVGRLIRDVEDRGIVVLCDNRLNSKAYGKKMLESLPEMRRSSELSYVRIFAKSVTG